MRSAWALALLVACTPDYSETAFLCRATTDCPADQTCIAGRCRRDDAHASLFCNPAGDLHHQSCDVGSACCLSPMHAHPTCQAAAETCSGVTELCTIRDDCTGSDVCCDLGEVLACTSFTCERVTCRSDADCPHGRPHCCNIGGTPKVQPWGYCQADAC